MQEQTIQDQIKENLEKIKIKIDTDTLKAHINNLSWPINPEGHTETVRNQILDIMDEFQIAMTQLVSEGAGERKRSDLVNSVNKKILGIALVGFDYEQVANDNQAGPIAIDFLTKELKIFLVENGGQVGTKHSQTLSAITNIAISNGLMDLKTLSKSSTSNTTQEQTSSKSTD